MACSDQELLAKMALDDPIAFHEIYTKYAEKLLIFAMGILPQKESCEDILQNIFVQLWQKRKDTEITHLKSYLYQAVKYQIIKFLKNSKVTDSEIMRLNLVDAELNASRKMEYEELEHLVDSMVRNLSPRCQQIFIMSRFEEKSNREISQELGLSIQSVKNQLTLATNKLREWISPDLLVPYQFILIAFIL